jgi:hypothetical protein
LVFDKGFEKTVVFIMMVHAESVKADYAMHAQLLGR